MKEPGGGEGRPLKWYGHPKDVLADRGIEFGGVMDGQKFCLVVFLEEHSLGPSRCLGEYGAQAVDRWWTQAGMTLNCWSWGSSELGAFSCGPVE